MKKRITPQQVLAWQTYIVYGLLLAILALCLYQLPDIKSFFQEYGNSMKAAFPIAR